MAGVFLTRDPGHLARTWTKVAGCCKPQKGLAVSETGPLPELRR
jgi:hypothetical protein